jgi:hypothetical protein
MLAKASLNVSRLSLSASRWAKFAVKSSISSAISVKSGERWTSGLSVTSPERLREAENALSEPRDGRRLSGVVG